MRWANIFRSGAFRLAMLFAGVFAIGSVAVLVVVERSVAHYALEATAGSLEGESGALRREYERSGRARLIAAVTERERTSREQTFRYLVLDAAGRQLAGDLPPGVRAIGMGQISFRNSDDGGELQNLASFGIRFGDGTSLIVATDTYDVEELRHRLDLFVIWCGTGITVLALAAGYLIAQLFLHRLERFNAAIETIMAGNFTERLPAIGMGPEFDQLSRNLNRMLDRISGLIDGLRQVSTDIAHDLRTPLSRLRQRLESIRGAGTAEAYDAGIDASLEQTDSILEIFRALLRIGTIEGGTGRSRFGPVNLSEVLERLYLVYQPATEDSGRRLVAAIQPQVFVNGDTELLAQLFVNLIENALAHTQGGAEIKLGLIATGRLASATIADNGPGVPPAERQNILKRFYRLDSSRHSAGAGLGLALVAAIAALHEARLQLDDNAPGLVVELKFPSVPPIKAPTVHADGDDPVDRRSAGLA